MSEKENPFHYFLKAVLHVSNCVQAHIAKFSFPDDRKPSTLRNGHPFPLFNLSLALPSTSTSTPERKQSDSYTRYSTLLPPDEQFLKKEKSTSPVTKEELGRATWTFLHTLAAQYPDKPTRQQKKDVKELMAILSRIYPCKDCADHFKEVLRSNPVQAGSQSELSQWLCHVHNVVNRSLSKLVFPCERVDARWGKLECEQRACDLQGANNPWD